MGNIDQPREPQFYPNEAMLPFHRNDKTEKTLQSIDSTLKRIDQTLIQLQNLFSVLGGQALSEQKSEEN